MSGQQLTVRATWSGKTWGTWMAAYSYHRRIGLMAVALAALSVGIGSAGAPATHAQGVLLPTRSGVWRLQTSGVSVRLSAVACPTAAACYAVGDGGAIVATTNGGATWLAQASGATFDLHGIACTDASTCTAVGNQGVIVVTTDGGATWANRTQHSGPLETVACPQAGTCYVGGDFAALKTVDGGRTWMTLRRNPTPPFFGIACPSISVCYAVGPVHVIEKTSDGGATWTSQSNPLAALSYLTILNAVACTDASTCTVVGQYGSLLTTRDGGATWALQAHQTSGPYDALYGIACPSGGPCVVAGTDGVRLATGGAGQRVWTSADRTHALNAIACGGGTACVAVGAAGTIVAAGGGSGVAAAAATITATGIFRTVNGHYQATSAVRVGETALYVVYYRSRGGVPTGKVRFVHNGIPSVWLPLRAGRAVDGASDFSARLTFPRTAAQGTYTAEFVVTVGHAQVARSRAFVLGA